MEVDTTAWSGEGTFTLALIDRLKTVGELTALPPRVLVQRGAQVFGTPEQFVTPAASNAYRALKPPMYTTPLATAGDDSRTPALAVHSGAHAFGPRAEPDVGGAGAQPFAPAASNAYSFSSVDAT